MTATADLLATLKRERTWEQVAELLGQYSGAFWRLVYLKQRHATVEQENIVRRACGLPEIEQSPAEAVAASGVDRVLHCSPRPNTALLVAAPGDVTRVTLGIGAKDDVATRIPVTLSYSNSAKRKRHRGSRLFTMSDIAALSPESLKTVRGKTGNIAAIREAARLAADNLSLS